MTEAALSRSEAPSLAKKSHCHQQYDQDSTHGTTTRTTVYYSPHRSEPRAVSSHRETKREFTYLSVSEESVGSVSDCILLWSLHYLIAKRKGDE